MGARLSYMRKLLNSVANGKAARERAISRWKNLMLTFGIMTLNFSPRRDTVMTHTSAEIKVKGELVQKME